jgi:rSAM/selenodomain-associated transferase 1
MAKASHPGRTKTRLSPPLTPLQAAELNTAFLRDIADNLCLAAQSAAIAPYMAFGPPGSAPFFEHHLPADVGLLEAWLPTFGECLRHAVRSLLDLGYGAACVLNSDSPTLPTSVLIDTARALRRPGDRIVLGPCADGGYYLLGVKSAHQRLFEDIAWSSERVLQQTRERAAELGLETLTLPTWYDVDDAASLHALTREALHGERFSARHRAHEARHTSAFLRQRERHGLKSADSAATADNAAQPTDARAAPP